MGCLWRCECASMCVAQGSSSASTMHAAISPKDTLKYMLLLVSPWVDYTYPNEGIYRVHNYNIVERLVSSWQC